MTGVWMRYSEWESIPEFLVYNLKNKIITGECKVGDRLPTEKELCHEYEAGRSSVREAVRILQAMGLVKVIQGKGTFVICTDTPEGNLDDIKKWYSKNTDVLTDLIDVRRIIEVFAVRKAVENITGEGFRELEGINTQFSKMVEVGDITNLIILDAKFHKTIGRISQNQFLQATIERLEAYYTEFRGKSFIITHNMKKAAEGHIRILEAMRSKDVDIAGEAMLEHINEFLNHLNQVI
jgi:GntR family transcriptional repressor for pyruvate dehydrogenase complex